MKELLVPVGNMECLKVAVFAGADAVYLGGKKFGARAFAGNFTDEEMISAIKFCHLYGVKIYVTVNTLVHESEIESALEYVKFLYANKVDAIIVQDLGLISKCKELYPNLDIHASTQVHSTNENTFKLLETLNVKRVVLAREVSVNEIDNIKTPLEKEAFIHGALCISYSGECLFSSMLMNRSGNRGECAQICRLPFKLIENDKEIKTNGEYILSTKELNTSKTFKDILDSSIYSLKIEGRMKSAEYVGCVTMLYRDLLDKYYNNKSLEVNEELYNDLMTIFNRKYTKGFILNSTNEELMNIETPNHLGTPLGKVIDINKKFISIKVDEPINQEDGIRFTKSNTGLYTNYLYDKNGRLINKANKNEIIMVDNKVDAIIGEQVNKTFDKEIAKKYRNIPEKKIDISIKFKANLNNKTELIISDGINEITEYGNIPELAQNRPVTKDNVITNLSKLGNTPFKLKNIDIDMDDNLFINLKDINEIRRTAIEKLIDKRENVEKNIIINNEKEKKYISTKKNIEISVLCRTEEQVKCALDNKANRIYITNRPLYNKHKELENVYLRTYRNGDNYVGNTLTTELGAVYNNKKSIIDYYLNVTNHNTIDFLSNYGKIITLSPELTFNEISNIMHYKKYDNLEIIIYGTLELMINKYCPLKLNINKDEKCHVCINGNKYYLEDRNGKQFRILTDPEIHLTHIMHHRPINDIENIEDYIKLGITNFRLELLNEDYNTVNDLILGLKK